MLSLVRSVFQHDRSIGTLTHDHGTEGTLEDAVRPFGLKIKDQTAIPEGYYEISSRRSPHFDREMIMLVTPEHRYTCVNGVNPFTFIYLHGGTDPSHSSGCILLPNLDNDQIWTLFSPYIGERLIIVNNYGGAL